MWKAESPLSMRTVMALTCMLVNMVPEAIAADQACWLAMVESGFDIDLTKPGFLRAPSCPLMLQCSNDAAEVPCVTNSARHADCRLIDKPDDILNQGLCNPDWFTTPDGPYRQTGILCAYRGLSRGRNHWYKWFPTLVKHSYLCFNDVGEPGKPDWQTKFIGRPQE
ncbi:hypothetical protein BCR37DRAFT_165483 [Protomyces lactucae-debilis]|uniref:Secreted protein n=1 Tax=Protomyces lactucae-debilis TaxID=2754530 RepID=A0A1Y2EXM0_PROLT|nr:uncharacterized protein BCR37DRAFT_165483 [Protomyces lactucae-debilis]ORY76362.1 hypothetical protein BCR37DRAFT_165483 [Protomyces lactucae-debilis]